MIFSYLATDSERVKGVRDYVMRQYLNVVLEHPLFDLARQLWALALQRKKVFLIPLLAVLLIIGGLLVFAQTSVLAPFIYTLF
jgi:uncharacterized protein DUF5989